MAGIAYNPAATYSGLEPAMLNEIKKDAQTRMAKSVEDLRHDLVKVRTGRASTALVDSIKVNYYGSDMPLGQVASVAVSDAKNCTDWTTSASPESVAVSDAKSCKAWPLSASSVKVQKSLAASRELIAALSVTAAASCVLSRMVGEPSVKSHESEPVTEFICEADSLNRALSIALSRYCRTADSATLQASFAAIALEIATTSAMEKASERA